MVLHNKADTAVFAQDVNHFRIPDPHLGVGIVMAVKDISNAAGNPVASGSHVDRTGRILCLCEIHHGLCVKLSPGLVERNPHNDALELLGLVKDVLPLAYEVFPGLGRELVRIAGVIDIGPLSPVVPLLVVAHAGHILPYQHAKHITIVEPAGRFNLDMLANHIETVFFGPLNIIS